VDSTCIGWSVVETTWVVCNTFLKDYFVLVEFHSFYLQ
jgi:hypothetical protein